LTVRNSTVSENEASQGGGILSDSAQTTRVLNTIVAGNVGVTGPDVSGHFADQGNNLIGSAEDSSGFTNSLFVGTAANQKTIGWRLYQQKDYWYSRQPH
ncbi:MAG: hypothetical protein AAGJ80_09680, partial [Cyanobacteria bacterium J06553_1]